MRLNLLEPPAVFENPVVHFVARSVKIQELSPSGREIEVRPVRARRPTIRSSADGFMHGQPG